MTKNAKPAQQAPAAEPLFLGEWKVPAFDWAAAAFGADLNQYPPQGIIPTLNHRYKDIVSALFFKGGALSDHGLRFRAGIDRAAAMTAIKAWLCSFAPKHEHKTATVAWALSEWCESTEGGTP